MADWLGEKRKSADLGQPPESRQHFDIWQFPPARDDMLSVSERSVQAWTKEAKQAEKAVQQDRAWDLWLDCRSERDIGDEIGISKSDAERMVSQERNSADLGHPPESRQHFDIWTFPPARDNTAGSSSYFGVMPPQVVENLLWFWSAVSTIETGNPFPAMSSASASGRWQVRTDGTASR